MAFEFFDAAGAATANGLFIPIADLPGLTAAELAPGDGQVLLGRSVFGLLKKIYSSLSPSAFNKLGVAVGNSETRPGTLLTNRTYTYQASYVSNLSTNSITQIPVAGIGVNSGLGKIALSSIFPAAAKVAAAANTPGAGVLIPTADLVPYGGPLHAALDVSAGQDNRNYLAALFNWMCAGNNLQVRATGLPSAIIAATRGNPTAGTLPANATATSNPTTGLFIEDIPLIFVSQVTYSITVQTIDNLATETFDVIVV